MKEIIIFAGGLLVATLLWSAVASVHLRRYKKELAEATASINEYATANAALASDCERLCREARTKGRLAAELLAELTPLKDAKGRRLQNLRDANARRSTRAGIPASVVEGRS